MALLWWLALGGNGAMALVNAALGTHLFALAHAALIVALVGMWGDDSEGEP